MDMEEHRSSSRHRRRRHRRGGDSVRAASASRQPGEGSALEQSPRMLGDDRRSLSGNRGRTPGRSGAGFDWLEEAAPSFVNSSTLQALVAMLERKGVKEAWQFKHLTKELLQALCTDDQKEVDLIMFSAACEVSKTLCGADAGASDNFAQESVRAMKAVAKRARAGSGRQRRDGSSSES